MSMPTEEQHLRDENERLRAELERAKQPAIEVELLPPPRAFPESSERAPARPTAKDIADIRAYFTNEKALLAQQIGEIEAFLGFVDVAEDLSQRLAKIESFIGRNNLG